MPAVWCSSTRCRRWRCRWWPGCGDAWAWESRAASRGRRRSVAGGARWRWRRLRMSTRGRRRLRRHLHQLTVLHEVSTRIVSALDPDRVLAERSRRSGAGHRISDRGDPTLSDGDAAALRASRRSTPAARAAGMSCDDGTSRRHHEQRTVGRPRGRDAVSSCRLRRSVVAPRRRRAALPDDDVTHPGAAGRRRPRSRCRTPTCTRRRSGWRRPTR